MATSGMQEVQHLDHGVLFEITVVDDAGAALDLSPSTGKTLLMKKPNGLTLSKTPTYSTDGTDGKIRYISSTTDLDTVGIWKLQAKIDFASSSFHSEVGQFRVNPNIV